MLLRRVIGDVLRARRQVQHRTLREVSTAANVSLGYLSEIERGQKEASSELLAAICTALGSQLSEVLRDASDTMALVEGTGAGLTDPALAEADTALADAALADRVLAEPALPDRSLAEATDAPRAPAPAQQRAAEGTVSVSVRRDGPLRTTLYTVRQRPSALARC